MHRDIKPHNILLKNIYTIKLSDFGFAKYYNATDLTKTMCGSPIYMAPEIMLCKKYNYKTDIWSVGIVLYELLFGIPPYVAQTHHQLILNIEANDIVFPTHNPISDSCRRFLLTLIVKDPEKRNNYK